MVTDYQGIVWTVQPSRIIDPKYLGASEDNLDPILIHLFSLKQNQQMHVVNPVTLLYNVQGSVFVNRSNQTFLLDQHKFLFLTGEFSLHSKPESFNDNMSVALKLPIEVLSQLGVDDSWQHQDIPITLLDYTQALKHTVTGIWDQLQREQPDQPIMDDLLITLVSETNHIFQKISEDIDRLPAKKRKTREELYRRLCLVKDYTYTHYAQAVKIQHLSRISYLNPFYLIREYKNMFGISPVHALIERRLEVAYALINSTEKSITQICHEIGYNDISSFSKLFKSKYGKAPLHVRQKTG